MSLPPFLSPRAFAFLLAFVGLAVLPLVPELYLCLRNHDGLRAFISIAYYELIVSFFLLAPALFLHRSIARYWILAVGILECATTLIVGWQAVTVGARWDLTSHESLLRTYPGEAWGYLHTFATWHNLLGTAIQAGGFGLCLTILPRFPS